MADERCVQHRGRRLARRKSRKVVLCGLFLVCSVLLSSCSYNFSFLLDMLRPNSSFVTGSSGPPVSDADLTLLLLAGVANPTSSNIQQVYSQIPRSQLDGISFSSFDAYVRMLGKMVMRDVGSFRFLSGSQREEKLAELAERSPFFDELVHRSYPIEVQSESKEESRFVYIQKRDDGTAFLSSTWVEACLALNRYAILYFHAIEEPNQPAMESLLSNAVNSTGGGEISSLVIDYKAQGILSYYLRQVRDSFVNFRLTEVDVSRLTYVQPDFFNETKNETVPRPVHFIRRTEQVISVRDTISSPLKLSDLTLFRDGVAKEPIRVGNTPGNNVISQFLGEPLVVSSTPAEDDSSRQVIVAGYPSFSLTALGSMQEDGSWWGQIIRIRIRNNSENVSLGSGLAVGMSLDNLLRQYPFADLEDYALEVTAQNITYRMTFSMDEETGGYVESINLEIVEPFFSESIAPYQPDADSQVVE